MVQDFYATLFSLYFPVGLCNKSDEIQNTGWIGAWEVGEGSVQKFETQVNIWIGVENHIHV